MKKQKSKKQSLVKKNKKGQGVLEYVILTCLIGMISLVAVQRFGSTLESKINSMRNKINRTILR